MVQKAVEELIQKHKQVLSRQDPDEAVPDKQYLMELNTIIQGLGTLELARLLEQLPSDDALLVWGQVDDSRADDVLCELSDDIRDALATEGTPLLSKSVVHAFELMDGRLRQVLVTSPADLKGINPIWIDLVGATKADRHRIGNYFGLELPDPEDLTDIESSARFYVDENDEIHLHSDFLLDREGDSRNVPVAFILFRDILFSVREEELPAFRLQRLRARIQTGYVSDGKDMLLDLYAADVEYSADSLEDIYCALGDVGKQVLSETMTDKEAAKTLAAVAEQEDLNGRIRRNVMDTRRAITFLMRRKLLGTEQLMDAKQILRDIESLYGHTAFLFDKINFLMDATVGFINVNQNKVIYRLTVLSVIFMPLNVIAGIGGMSEFSMMTKDIPWQLSYAIFSVGMAIVAWVTFVILRIYERRTK